MPRFGGAQVSEFSQFVLFFYELERVLLPERENPDLVLIVLIGINAG